MKTSCPTITGDMFKHDIIIVGGGLAGLRAALSARGDMAVISKVHPLALILGLRGINAALGNKDRFSAGMLPRRGTQGKPGFLL